MGNFEIYNFETNFNCVFDNITDSVKFLMKCAENNNVNFLSIQYGYGFHNIIEFLLNCAKFYTYNEMWGNEYKITISGNNDDFIYNVKFEITHPHHYNIITINYIFDDDYFITFSDITQQQMKNYNFKMFEMG